MHHNIIHRIGIIAASIALIVIALTVALLASGDENRLYNLEDAAGMFNERGYAKANSYSLDGNEAINDFNGNLMYSQRLSYLPISENGLHADLKIAYNGDVSHVVFGARSGANDIIQTPVNHPEWILSLNGIAVQTFNFENELISWRTITGGNDSISQDDDVASLVEGYHKCYRVSSMGGIHHGVIGILMEDGSVREYYSDSASITGPAYMKGGAYNSRSKDDPDRGYLWPAGNPLYGHFTLFRSDGTRVLFKVYQPAFRTNLNCVESFPSGRDDYPRILLPVKFQDQMGHEIALSYIYKVDNDTVWGRPILSSAGDFGLSWSDWTPGTTNNLQVSSLGGDLYTIYFANRVSEAGLPGRGASWRWDVNRGQVWWIFDSATRSTKFTYRPYSRDYWIQGIEGAMRTHNVCGSVQKKAGAVYKLDPWRIWKIQYPEGGQEFITYYKDPATAWGQVGYLGPKDTMSIKYDYSQNCELDEGNRFPCKKTGEFDAIGRDPFFLNMVVAARRTTSGTSVVNTDSLIFSWVDALNDLSINSNDQFITQRWFAKDSLGGYIDPKNQHPQIKSRELVYRYYPEKGPFSSRSRDRGWALKMVSSLEKDRYVDGSLITKNYYWNTSYAGGICCGTLLLDSLKTTYDAESIWERYAYSWLGNPSSESVNNLIRRDVIDPWLIRTETYYDTSFMRLSGSSDAYYDNGLIDSVVTKRVSDNVLLRRSASQYCGATASNGYTGQLSRTSEFLLNASGGAIDSVVQSLSYYKSDAPSVMHQGATKWHIDPLQDTTFYYCTASDQTITFCQQAYDGSVDTFTTNMSLVDCGPFWYKMQRHVGSQTLTWYRKVNERGWLLWVIEPNRYRSEATYDNLNRVVKITLPGGYVPTNKAPLPPDTAWSVWNLYDDEFTTDPVSVTQMARVDKTFPSQKNRVWIDGLSRSRRHDVLNPDGSCDSVVVGYDFAGRAVSTQDQLGFVTTIQYDHRDRTVKTVYPDPSHSSDSTKYSVTNAQTVGLASKFVFRDSLLFAQWQKDENGSTSFEYYDIRNLLRRRQTYAGSTFFDYDDLGNLTLIIRPKGDSVKYTYNSLGQLIAEQASDYVHAGTSERGTFVYRYDKNGNLTGKKDPNIEAVINYPITDAWQYNTYDAMNRIVESGRVFTMFGDPEYLPYHRYFYDQDYSELSKGRLSLAFTIDPGNICNYAERYHYDPRGRIKRQVNYFNAVLETVVISGSPSDTEYTARGDSVVIQYTYDWADQVKSITYGDGMVVKQKWDNRGRLTSVGGASVVDSEKYAHIDYTHRDQVETLALGGNLQQMNYLYNERGWLQSINGGSSSPGGAPGDVFGQELYYYSHPIPPSPPEGWGSQYNGNLFGQKISMMGQDTTFAYRYDHSDRLRGVKRGSSWFESFTCDANGNFTQCMKSTVEAVVVTSFSYFPGTNKLRIADKPTWMTDDTLTYDPNGNVTSHSGKKMTASYDQFNVMKTVRINTNLGADTIQYGYNAAGERIYKAYSYRYRAACGALTPNRVGSPGGGEGDLLPIPMCTYSSIAYTYYIVSQGKVLAEQSRVSPLSAKAKFIYAGNSRIAMRDSTARLHYYLNDHLGSVRVVIDSTGLVKDKYWYYAYGESRYEQVSANQSYRYTSKPLDREGKLNVYYYGARYYDPELGRFWSVDPAAGKYPGWSPYAYCLDNPLRNVDPDGGSALDKVAGALAALIDNNTPGGADIRGWYEPSDAADYNLGQDIGDALSIVQGAVQIASGAGMASGGGAIAVGSGGTAAVAGAPVTAAGAVVFVQGALAAGSGVFNLAMQKGRASGGEDAKKARQEFESTAKPQYWKGEAARNPSNYSAENLARMKQGKSPIGPNGKPVELHHKTPLSKGGTNDPDNLEQMSPDDHRLGENYRKNHP